MATDVSSNSSRSPTRHVVRAWRRVRWKIMAIVVFTGTSTVLVACLGVAALNVVVRRETANVVEKQIQVLVQASRSVAPAILDHAGACNVAAANAGVLKPLLAFTDEAFPQAHALVTADGSKHPDWMPETGFTGLVVDRGKLEIRNLLSRQKGACKATVIFSLPLGSELAKRLSSVAGMEVTARSAMPFRVHSPSQRVLRTIEGNFLPGVSPPAAVVLTVRNWETGALEDWIAYSVRVNYLKTFEDVASSIAVAISLPTWMDNHTPDAFITKTTRESARPQNPHPVRQLTT